MNAPACPRAFEAEAMRDGRLAGTALASFARHATVCAACGREVQALDAIAAGLRASPGRGAHPDELHRLRERTRLIAAFDRTLVSGRRSPAWRRTLAPAIATAMIAAALLFWRARSVPELAPAPAIVVRAATATVWSRHPADGGERIVLDRGELWIQIDHERPKTKLIVALPDGELEDTGTTFTVSAADGRTIGVAVEEGAVLLRIRGEPPVAIRRGERWSPRPTPHVPDAAPPSDHARMTRQETATPAPPPRRVSSRVPAVPLDAPDPALDYRTAVALLQGGSNREAATAFADFVAKHPRHRRAEDAAYLRVIALQRSGAGEDTASAAREYLRRYPTGFRRSEMERLSR